MTCNAIIPPSQHRALTPCVWIADDDRGVLDAMARVLCGAGYGVRAFTSGKLLLEAPDGMAAGCIVLDLWMPDMSGLEVQEALVRCCNPAPVAFVSAHGDVSRSVRAMKAGASDFLTKPFDAAELVAAVEAAIAQRRVLSAAQSERISAAQLVSQLTPREKEVLEQLLQGKRNKEIAKDLGAAERTIKVHRSRVQQKMGVRSIVELAGRIERAGLRAWLMRRTV